MLIVEVLVIWCALSVALSPMLGKFIKVDDYE